MKSLRSTWILLLLAGLGAAYIYWNERDTSVTPGAVVLLRAPQNSVRSVRFSPSNLEIARAHPGDEFSVHDAKTSLSAPLDEAAAVTLWAQLDLVQSQLPVDNPQDLQRYGLENPRASIQVDDQKLEFGVLSPFDKNLVYARNNGKVALVSTVLKTLTTRSFNQWRDRAVVGKRVAKAGAFSLRNQSAVMSFESDEAGNWRLSAPKNHLSHVVADPRVVEELLGALSQAKITRWLDERGQNAARFGLNSPSVIFDSGDIHLEVGAKAGSGYAARSSVGTGPIFEIPASFFVSLNRPLRDWRDKRVAVFEADEVAKLEIVASQKTRILLREGDNWRLENGENDPEVRAAAVDLMEFARDLRALDFVDDAAKEKARNALGSPILTLKALDSRGAGVFELRFGRARQTLFAQNQSANFVKSLFEIDTSALDEIRLAQATLFGPPK